MKGPGMATPGPHPTDGPTDLVLFGTGHAAQTVAVYLAHHGAHRIVGYTVDAAFRTADTHDGLPVVDWHRLEERFPPDRVRLFGPFSHARMNTLRRDRYLEGRARGYRFARFIHPSCHVYTDAIGENCLILEGCVIQPFATIGDNVMIWSMCVIGHHAQIGDHCFLSAQVGVGGRSTLGPECYLTAQTGVLPGLRLGRGCAVLNEPMVTCDLPDLGVIVGAGGTRKPYPSTRLHRIL